MARTAFATASAEINQGVRPAWRYYLLFWPPRRVLGVLARGVLGLLTRAFDFRRFAAWAQDRLADVAVDDINYTTRSNVDSVSIQAKAAAKIMA